MANAPEKKSYEEQWQQAFNEAEMPPSPNVWKSIDQELTAQEGGKYRKGFFFYRAVAASLLLCIAAGLSWYLLSRPADSDQIVQDNVSSAEEKITTLDEANQDPNPANGSSAGSATQTESETETESPLADNTDQSNSDETSSAAGNVALGTIEEDNSTASDRTKSSANNTAQLAVTDTKKPASAAKTLIFPNEEVSPREEELLSINHRVGRLAALPPDALAVSAPTWADNVEKLYFVPQYREREVLGEEKSGAQFFAGLAMAPSLFDPNFQSQNEAALAVANAPVAESFSYALSDGLANTRSLNSSSNTVMVAEGLENQSSVSLSYGFDVGLTLGEHWSIESGLDYQNFQTVTQTQYTVVDLRSGERYPLLATNAVANQATAFNTTSIGTNSEVDNQFQFVSVPLRVGYNVHFSKITLSINPGVAANLFLGNRISSQDFASTTLNSDGGSPFNSQYISGLLSGGVYYQLLENYSLSFSPSYQFALSDFARSAATFNSLPQSLGLKFGFRYNFQ